MIEVSLTEAIRGFVSEACKDFLIETRAGTESHVRVFNSDLPIEPEESEFPFVVVRAESGITHEETTDVTVSLYIGVYDSGAVDLVGQDIAMDIMARIRTALMRMPTQVLQNRYQFKLPIKWEAQETQRFPYWVITMTSTWTVYNPHPLSFD